MTERNQEIPEASRIAFRIGINLGDVIVENDDIFGDGVNVAARLQELADPGGIIISRSARDQVRDRLDLTLEDLGEQEVKNFCAAGSNISGCCRRRRQISLQSRRVR